MRRTCIALLAALMLPSAGSTATWKSDPSHASVQFAVSHLMVSTVRGTFDAFDVTIVLDEDDVERSSVTATIDTASVNTRDEKRDAHLRGPDFFDVVVHPTMTFRSTQVEKIADARYRVTGDLTLLGITRQVVLDVRGSPRPITDPRGIRRMGGSVTTTIHRPDFGLTYNSILDTGGVSIGEDVDIVIDLQLVPAP